MARAASVAHLSPDERALALRADFVRAAPGCADLTEGLMALEGRESFRVADWIQHEATHLVDRCGPGSTEPRALLALFSVFFDFSESRAIPLDLAREGEPATAVAISAAATLDDVIVALAAAPRSTRIRIARDLH